MGSRNAARRECSGRTDCLRRGRRRGPVSVISIVLVSHLSIASRLIRGERPIRPATPSWPDRIARRTVSMLTPTSSAASVAVYRRLPVSPAVRLPGGAAADERRVRGARTHRVPSAATGPTRREGRAQPHSWPGDLRWFSTNELICQVVASRSFRSEVASPHEADALDVRGSSCCCAPLLVAIDVDNDPPTG